MPFVFVDFVPSQVQKGDFSSFHAMFSKEMRIRGCHWLVQEIKALWCLFSLPLVPCLLFSEEEFQWFQPLLHPRLPLPPLASFFSLSFLAFAFAGILNK